MVRSESYIILFFCPHPLFILCVYSYVRVVANVEEINEDENATLITKSELKDSARESSKRPNRYEVSRLCSCRQTHSGHPL